MSKEKTESKQRFYLDVLNSHNHNMFSTLLYESHITSDNLKTIDVESTGMTYEGYYAKKDRKKYLIDENVYKNLPIRIGKNIEELHIKEDVVLRPLNPIAFKITPKNLMSVRELVDNFAPFDHSNEEHWLLQKIIALAGYICKVFVCIATESSFGKSSVYDVVHYITDKSPVFKPRSVPGVLNQINGTGNLVFDETHRCKKEVRDIIEEFALQIGAGKVTYLNGALQAKNTKQRYNCSVQSITFLYNVVGQYKDAEKDYFEFIFSNNDAVDDRFLKLKLDGRLVEVFNKDFDIDGVAEINKMYYIDLAKELLYLQELKMSGKHVNKWRIHSMLDLKGRKKRVFKDICWLLDCYCESQLEFDNLVNVFDKTIIGYKEMVSVLKPEAVTVEEEIVE